VIYYIICITGYFLSHLCTMYLCKDLGGALAKICVQRHLRPLYLIMNTFRGSFSLNCWIHTSLLFNQIVLSSITKKGEIESASRLQIILVIVTMQFGRMNAFNEMCAGLKE
jgi:hypothetical protein